MSKPKKPTTKPAMDKKAWVVSIPIAGAIHIEVEGAASREEAIKAAWAKYNNEGSDCGEVEWEAHETIASGNVCHASFNQIEAHTYER